MKITTTLNQKTGQVTITIETDKKSKMIMEVNLNDVQKFIESVGVNPLLAVAIRQISKMLGLKIKIVT